MSTANKVTHTGYDGEQDKTMQTNSEMNTTTPGAAPGFGGMPRPAAAATNGARWQKHSKRLNGHTPPAPPREPPTVVTREPPTVVNGRCEFGQCEHESKPEAAGNPSATRTEAPPAPDRPARAPMPALPERKAPVVKDGRCEFGQCDTPSKAQATGTTGGQTAAAVGRAGASAVRPSARLRTPGPIQYPSKVADTKTYAGQRVTGIRIGRGDNVTGNELGAKLPVTGSQYLGTESGYVPRATGVKVGAARTAAGQVVTGTQVRSKVMVTGDESNQALRITGDADQALEDDLIKRREPGAQVTSQFPRMGGGNAVAGARPDPVTGAKVPVSGSWGGQRITGVEVEHNPRVTGDEPGACAPITGTPYVGPGQYQAYCQSDDIEDATRRVAPGLAVGSRVTGTPVNAGHVTGIQRGAGLALTGTPYYRADVEDNMKGVEDNMKGNVLERISSRFSVRSPQREAQLHSDFAAVKAPSAHSRMTGSFAAGAGKITGNQEFHFSPRGAEAAAGARDEKKSRITGEGKVEGPAITGYAWGMHPNVTGTEGYIAAERNPSERAGKPHGFASARRFAERTHGEIPPSKITGSSGNTVTGTTVTLSGGARG